MSKPDQIERRVVEEEMTVESPSTPETDVVSELVSEVNLVVGVPTYNEEIAIGSVVLRAQRYADEVIVVDDGSTDRTVEIARQAGATVLELGENQGKGRAIRTLLAHVQNLELDALVVLDGDGQHDPEDIPVVAEPVVEENCDLTIGSRYLNGNRTDTPFHRRVGQRVLDVLTFGSSGEALTDTQSGFRAFSTDAISTLNIRTDGMGVESEVISEASNNGMQMTEVPIDVRYDGLDGQTHNPFRHGLAVAGFVVQLIRDRHPLVFFGLPGAILLITGGLLGVHTTLLYQSSGTFYQWRALLSVLVTILGVVSLFSGLILSQISNMVEDVGE